MRTPLPCPVCAALVMDDHAHIAQHVTWHEDTKTLGPKRGSYSTAIALHLGFEEMRAAVALAERDDDDAPTAKLPPVRDTVRRRPPVPPALIPGTPEQWRRLAAAMEDDGLDVEDLADDDRAAGPACERCAHPAHRMARCPVPYPTANARPGETCGCLVGPA